MSQQCARVKNELAVKHLHAIDELFGFSTSYLIDLDINSCIDVNTNLV